MREYLEGKIRAYFVKHHGEGAANQYDFYRCSACKQLYTWNKIRSGNICCSNRLSPTNPTVWETFKLLLLPWTV